MSLVHVVDELPPLPLILRPAAALRAVLRLVLILALITLAWVGYWLFVDRRSRRARAEWLHRLCFKVAKVTGIRVEVIGALPASGLVVANHLSYLDIILLSAIARPAFVAKSEVAAWPFFGRCARYSGSIFVERERRGAVAEVAEKMRVVLAAGVPLVLFPEGTSSGGDSVLPFQPSLFAPVAELGGPVAACAIDYTLLGGSVPDEVCYWRDHTFAPHLLNLLSKTGLGIRIAFGPARVRTGDRKAIARELHAEVVALRR